VFHNISAYASRGFQAGYDNMEVIMEPLFNGTVYLVRMFFTVNGVTFALTDGDLKTAISYLTLAAVPISRFANQYGPNGLSINQSYFAYGVNLTEASYSDGDLKSWANQIVSDNHLPQNSCIGFLNPLGIDIRGSDSRSSGTGGAHYHSNGRPYLFVHTQGSPLTVSDKEWFFAGRLSHEVAEMTVNPLGGNPEVCDPCGPNYNSTYIAYFDVSGAYIETSQTPPYNVSFPFSFFINAIVQPKYADPKTAPVFACSYIPPGYVRGQLSFGVGITVSQWHNDGCSDRYQLQGETIELHAVIQSLNAPYEIQNTVFAWDQPMGAQLNGASDGAQISLTLTTAATIHVTVTVIIQDSFSTVSQKGTITIAVLTPTEAASWGSFCNLRNQLRLIPQPVPIGDPALRQLRPFTTQYLASLRDVVGSIRREAQSLENHLNQLTEERLSVHNADT
jgi:hypothetical protein